ncbi:ABC transporter permease [Verminephrobacter eiseniae]|uniref:Binding-protein-dependent transport systems inner membrane component n=1 Tax=Verminephrobacter eiseniae (strain EF01-2) TaxID=391735 RepID=A1WJ90_VEREI|nr:ABC transporter permease [Verminephrobacter eiseniae]ABM57697.1 binding-protein-dependent transport systems inner membrane component [Verminephrobacter eiseniae EF01-2]MCW5283316.1 ABC transporter permease [Verminephrobacter eiseniae]MCW5303632.1 ABC transporter permease [Verminephrobacter eiseniae]MCW8178197.1 ABC transporter permease [Verminephrobacter eiseniae]MCW8188426.1 ABC transporter permease [Verminephrobacter eiseniae]
MSASTSVDTSGGLAGRLSFYLVLTPFLLWMLLIIVLPHVDLLLLSFKESATSVGLANYREFFGEPVYLRTLARTVVISILTTLLILLISWPVAYYIAKLARGRSKTSLYLACLLPFWVGELVRVFGWTIILRETGLLSRLLQHLGVVQGPIEFLYNDAAMIVGLIYTLMLFMIVPLISVLETLDDSLVEAGYDLGGNGWIVLRQIVIPHAMPGIASGCIIVFMLSLGSFLTPILMGGKSSQWFTEQIYTQFITRFNWELGSAFGFVLLAASSLVVWAGLKLSGQSLSSSLARGS